ncbi:hypothetical protein BKA93DRAFT_823417 [Sparassis latifolia]|uniref:Uncharacterized protein n=1 Tax=Sparassis crispa TaxID=139825 RepID=A0A401GXZ7_9APHY|nr:hypothetical protein SCP_0905540 [Sparassis crispa]GBE86674.1 hypothetical protein SCP_0905540 [Sparassis crispa]
MDKSIIDSGSCRISRRVPSLPPHPHVALVLSLSSLSSPSSAMDFTPTSPSPTVRSRPHGPRGPKLMPKTVRYDMNSRLEEPTPAYSSPRSSSSSLRPATSYQLDMMSTPPSPRPGTSMEVSRASTPSTPAFKVIPKRPTLPTPPPLKFDSVPVAWRGMTLEAAQWSMTSEQLQELVSGAIRKSAEESFIRLVRRETFEGELDAELDRLESLRATTQSQYRFNMHRRTMLLQSLNALSYSAVSDAGDGEALFNLTTQLADVTVSCDRLMETLLTISDQRGQIQRLQDVHVGSALSMALRKLNASYGKRKAELQEARDTIEELKAQLEEAWDVAEDMAQEMDYLDNFQLSDDEDYTSTSAVDAMSVHMAEVVGVTGRAVATTATLTNLPGELARQGDRASRVSAAKTRSMLASKASLRIPTRKPSNGTDLASRQSLRRRFSKSSRGCSVEGGAIPNVPTIQIALATPLPESSFLDLADTRPTTPATPANSTLSDVPPVPSMPVIPDLPRQNMDSTLRRDSNGSLKAIHDSPITAPTPSPGFRTFIPPDRSGELSPRAPGTRSRAQSVQIASSASTVTVLRRSRSEYRIPDGWSLPDNIKPKTYSVPLRATEVNETVHMQTVSAFTVNVDKR